MPHIKYDQDSSLIYPADGEDEPPTRRITVAGRPIRSKKESTSPRTSWEPGSAPDCLPPLSTSGQTYRQTIAEPSRRPSLPGHTMPGHQASRGSLAKIHSMQIEAPITQVFGILTKLKETVDRPEVCEKLDQALGIIQCSELYTPAEISDLRGSFIGNGVAQDLVEGLMRPTQQHRRSSAGETHLSQRSRDRGVSAPPHNLNSSLSLLNPTSQILNPSTPYTPLVPDSIQKYLNYYEDWDWNILALEKHTDYKPLRFLGMKIFREFEVPRLLQTDEATVEKWLVLMEANYLSNNPYHNSTHAADVLAATAYFLRTERCRNLLSDFDTVASLIAATIHDVDHPGRTNAFLCNSRHELALLYNDTAVLENHHVAKSFKITLDQENRANIFSQLNHEDYQTIRGNVIDMVLATELGKHFEHVNKFISSTRPVDDPERSPRVSQLSLSQSDNDDNELRTLVKRVLIKVADVSNPARSREQCIEWTRRICEEYFAQTQEESDKGLPIVMPTFQRDVCSIPKTQTAFINYFLLDMFDAWHEFCDVPKVREHLRDNLRFWDDMDNRRLTTIEEILENCNSDLQSYDQSIANLSCDDST